MVSAGIISQRYYPEAGFRIAVLFFYKICVNSLHEKSGIPIIFRCQLHLMKSTLLTLAAVICSLASFAQTEPDYYRELSINGGIAPFTHPGQTEYVGTEKTLPYYVSISGHYNFTEHWQVGLDLSVTHWEGSKDINNYNGPFGQTYTASRTTKYIYADKVWTPTVRINYLIPIYDKWQINRANFYVGVAGGPSFTVNDGGITWQQYMNQPGEDNRYMSQYNYEWGTGYTMGLQVGYSHYFGNHFGINFEFAPRYTYVNLVDHRVGSINSHFDVWSYPVTAGIKFRF